MKSSNRPKIVQFFVFNWQKKLLSLLLAIALWFFVFLQNFEEQTATIPIQFENLPDDLIILETSDDVATITVRARKNILTDIDYYSSITPYVELSNATLGESYYPLELRLSNEKNDFTTSLSKDELKIIIDRVMTNEVEIQPRIIGNPVSGYALDSIELSQDTAVIRGPSQIISGIEFIETSSIDMEVSSNTTLEVALIAPEQSEIVGDDTVSVTINISQKLISQEVSITVELVNLDNAYLPLATPEITLDLTMPERYRYSYGSRVSVAADASSVNSTGRFLLPITINTSSDISVTESVEYISLQFTASTQGD